MIITVVCDVLGKENNGTTIATMNLIRFLRSQGHTVRILCGDQDKKGQENVFVVPNYNLGKILNAYVNKVGVTLAKPVNSVIQEAIQGVDLIHIMTPLPLGLATSKKVRELGIPMTAGFHMQAENLTSYFKLNRVRSVNKLVYKYIWKHLYQYVDCIHFPTEFIRNMFEKNIKRKTKGQVISNGVNPFVSRYQVERPAEWNDKILILTTGRYAREKSQDTLLKAVSYSKHKDKIQLILAGQGIKEKYYFKLAKELPIKPLFKLFDRKEIIDILNMCDLYVHPAEIELEGIACLEAITCGKLTIVSDSELSATKNFAIDEKCIFEKRNPKDLARVIDFWIENPELRHEYEQKYLDSAIAFDQNECMKKMEHMMLEVINEKKK